MNQPDDLYTELRRANAATAGESFDGHVIASIVAAGAIEARAGASFTSALGMWGTELRSDVERYFPAALDRLKSLGLDTEPTVDEDERCLRELLRCFRTVPTPLASLLSVLIARRATRPNHLWQDMGLVNRGELFS